MNFFNAAKKAMSKARLAQAESRFRLENRKFQRNLRKALAQDQKPQDTDDRPGCVSTDDVYLNNDWHRDSNIVLRVRERSRENPEDTIETRYYMKEGSDETTVDRYLNPQRKPGGHFDDDGSFLGRFYINSATAEIRDW